VREREREREREVERERERDREIFEILPYTNYHLPYPIQKKFVLLFLDTNKISFIIFPNIK